MTLGGKPDIKTRSIPLGGPAGPCGLANIAEGVSNGKLPSPEESLENGGRREGPF